MRLSEYLHERVESESAFARRANVSQRTINRICQGLGCNADTALAVIAASRAAPTKTGGVVTLEGLQSQRPDKASRRPTRKRRGRAARTKRGAA